MVSHKKNSNDLHLHFWSIYIDFFEEFHYLEKEFIVKELLDCVCRKKGLYSDNFKTCNFSPFYPFDIDFVY